MQKWSLGKVLFLLARWPLVLEGSFYLISMFCNPATFRPVDPMSGVLVMDLSLPVSDYLVVPVNFDADTFYSSMCTTVSTKTTFSAVCPALKLQIRDPDRRLGGMVLYHSCAK